MLPIHFRGNPDAPFLFHGLDGIVKQIDEDATHLSRSILISGTKESKLE